MRVDQYIRTASLTSELLVSEGISAAASGKSLAGLSSISKLQKNLCKFEQAVSELPNNESTLATLCQLLWFADAS